VLLFSACTDIIDANNRTLYNHKGSVLGSTIRTSAENDYRSVQNGENPLKRPTYDEYMGQ